MNTILFRLGGVPEDEANEIRALLESHAIDTFETAPRLFGVSPPAIWVHDREQLERGRALIDAYQRERSARIRGEHEQARLEGRTTTLIERLAADPLRIVLYLMLAAVIVFFTIMPFIWLG